MFVRLSLKTFIPSFLIATGLSIGAYQYATADSAAPVVLVDAGAPVVSDAGPPSQGSAATPAAGSGSGSAQVVTVVVPPPGSLHDPAENPLAAYDDAKTLQKAGWAALVFGLLLMLSKALAYAKGLQDVPVIGAAAKWIADGKRAVYVAALGAIAAAGYNAVVAGGGWAAVAMAVGAVLVALVHPTTQPTSKAAG